MDHVVNSNGVNTKSPFTFLRTDPLKNDRHYTMSLSLPRVDPSVQPNHFPRQQYWFPDGRRYGPHQ